MEQGFAFDKTEAETSWPVGLRGSHEKALASSERTVFAFARTER